MVDVLPVIVTLPGVLEVVLRVKLVKLPVPFNVADAVIYVVAEAAMVPDHVPKDRIEK